MSKKSIAEYNENTMKTLDAKALKVKKDNLHAEFEKEKAQAVSYEQLIASVNKKRSVCLENMTKLKGAYRVIEDLERQIGIKPSLPAKAATEKPEKK